MLSLRDAVSLVPEEKVMFGVVASSSVDVTVGDLLALGSEIDGMVLLYQVRLRTSRQQAIAICRKLKLKTFWRLL